MDLTRTETYLTTFHNAHPGATSRSFGALPVTCGEQAFASTHLSLISMLPAVAAQLLTVLDLACGDGHLLSLVRDSTPAARLSLIGVNLNEGDLRFEERYRQFSARAAR